MARGSDLSLFLEVCGTMGFFETKSTHGKTRLDCEGFKVVGFRLLNEVRGIGLFHMTVQMCVFRGLINE